MSKERLNMDLSGKTAIVTGGSRGIGKAISLALAQAGANIVIAARSEEEPPSLPGTIYKTAEEIKVLGGKALPVRCDVTASGEVENMVEKAVSTYGAIDILVNNAGVLHGATFLETEISDFDNIWRVNVRGVFLCTRAVLPIMMQRKRGSIISISSNLVGTTFPGNNAYAASKAALDQMMIKLAEEVAEYNIAINLLRPGHIGSEGMLARAPAALLDSLSPPSVVGPAAVWLAAQDATSYTGKICERGTFGSEWP